jgi:hypothetical protein
MLLLKLDKKEAHLLVGLFVINEKSSGDRVSRFKIFRY